MPHVVIVHGISHRLDAADTIRAERLPALAGGVRNAGFEAIADRLSPDSGAGPIRRERRVLRGDASRAGNESRKPRKRWEGKISFDRDSAEKLSTPPLQTRAGRP